jgi:hypothetical protein
MERVGLNKLCILRKTINMKNVIFPSRLSGIVRRHLKIKNGFYFVITVSDISNISIVGDLKQDYKTSKVLDGVE